MANFNECQECGCKCSKCANNDHYANLHAEIENLKQKLADKDNDVARIIDEEQNSLKQELLTWQDKHKRLYESHQRTQNINQGLEEKLLRLVEVCETDKSTFTKDIANLSHKLAEANYTIKKLMEDKERYKNDVALAVQFLQCNQSNFVAHRIDSLPNEFQAKLTTHTASKKKTEEKVNTTETRNIKVPIPTFPPTAMVYSIPKTSNPQKQNDEKQSAEVISTATLAKILEEHVQERTITKHCDTCTCSKNYRIISDISQHTVGTQTTSCENSFCSKCNKNTNNYELTETVQNDNKNGQEKRSCNTGQEVNKNKDGCVKENETNSLCCENNLVEAPRISKKVTDSYKMCSNSIEQYDAQKKGNETFNVNQDSNAEERLKMRAKYYSSNDNYVNKKNMDNFIETENMKGPRFCSVRMQSGSKNILLDNVNNSFSPILYTHPSGKKSRKPSSELPKLDNSLSPQKSYSCPSLDYKHVLYDKTNVKEGFTNKEGKLSNLESENSIQNQQRVVEWIQNQSNVFDNNYETGRRGILITNIRPEQYAEMENNVKKFLFGEKQTEPFQKVEISRRKNLRDCGSVKQTTNQVNVHMETEI